MGRRAIAKESERHMSTQLDSKSIPGMTKEVREELAATFDALSNWRDEIETANERSLARSSIERLRSHAPWVGRTRRCAQHGSTWKAPQRRRRK